MALMQMLNIFIIYNSRIELQDAFYTRNEIVLVLNDKDAARTYALLRAKIKAPVIGCKEGDGFCDFIWISHPTQWHSVYKHMIIRNADIPL